MELLERLLGHPTGTEVVLDEVRGAYPGPSDLEASRWLESTISVVKTHLGVVFHRWITLHGVKIELEVVESTDTEESMPIPVSAIDPFHTDRPGTRTIRDL